MKVSEMLIMMSSKLNDALIDEYSVISFNHINITLICEELFLFLRLNRNLGSFFLQFLACKTNSFYNKSIV